MPFYIEHEYTAQSHLIECLFNMHRELSSREAVEYSDCIPIAVFTAFAIESYINGIGARIVKFWDAIERNNWQSKVDILHSIADEQADWGCEPLTFVKETFKLRDKLAHGKPEVTCKGPYSTRTEASDHYRKVNEDPEWIRKLNRKWLENSKRRFIGTMEYLRDLHDLPVNDHLLYEKTDIVERND